MRLEKDVLRERAKHYSEASPEELQRREREHLVTAVNAAIDAAENLRTALHELGQVTGDNPLDWRYGPLQEVELWPPMELREILNSLIKELEGG